MPLRHSLLLRLLAVSLAVAALAVAATAWLITRDTTHELRSDIERSLERDNHIHQQLVTFAETHATWDGVEAVVAGLAAETGERVALTTPDGTMLADSAAGGDTDPPALPAAPAAVVDPLAAGNEEVPGTSDPTTTTTGEMPLTSDPPDTAGRPRAFPLPASRETIESRRAQQLLVEEAGACLADHGAVRPLDPEDGFPSRLDDLGWDLVPAAVVEACVDPALFAPSEAEAALGPAVKAAVVACLAQAEADPAASQAASPQDRAAQCLAGGVHQARDAVRADPALLYLGTAGAETRFDTLWGADRARTAATVAAVLAVAAAVTVVAGRRLVRPVRALTRAAERMQAGDHGARVPVKGRDEVGGLAHAFNAMAESLEAGADQRRAMVSDVAHELRSPLANIQGYLEAAQDGVVPLDDALIASLLDDATTLHRLVDDLQVLALADAGRLTMHRQPVDAAELVQAVVVAQRGAAAAAHVRLEADAPQPVPVAGDPDRLRQVLVNLVGNALRYTPPGGRVTVTASPAGGTAVLTVHDSGIGIAPDHLPHVFDRFYRCDASRSRETGGSGLGLAIVRQLVAAHGGTVTAASEPGRGSTFTVRLPLDGGPELRALRTARSLPGSAPGSAASTRAG
jgi:two-component system, OmpR family, sensor histidine kinase BaeS